MAGRSISAALSALFGASGLAAAAAGPAAARLGVLPPLAAFAVFAVGLGAGGVGSLVLGVVGLARTRSGSGRAGRGWAWTGILAGLALTVVLALTLGAVREAPRIHDLTTDPEDPPAFSVAAQDPANRGRDLTYPEGGPAVPRLQRQAYPDLAPLVLDLAPGEAFIAAREAADDLGWTVTWANAELGVLEAYDTTPVFAFVDDVVVRVRPGKGGGSVVDVRSTSRVGVSDLGANAGRIRRFLDRVASSVR